jgi:hypothetical protein
MNNDIIVQAKNAMKILSESYPDEEHVFAFDNATTHTK